MMELRILRRGSGVKDKVIILDFRRLDFNLFKDLFGRDLWNKTGEKRGPKKLVDVEGIHPPSSRAVHPNEQEVRQKYQQTCMDQQRAPAKLKLTKEVYRRWQQGQVT